MKYIFLFIYDKVMRILLLAFLIIDISVSAEITGIVKHFQNNHPIAGIEIQLSHAFDGKKNPLITISDDEGKYKFNNIPIGGYTISIDMPRYLPSVKFLLIQFNEQRLIHHIALIPSGKYPKGDTGAISGSVASALDSTPLENAMVILSQQSGKKGKERFIAIDTTYTDSSGTYLFSGISSHLTYISSASASGYKDRYSHNIQLNSNEIELNHFFLEFYTPPSGAIEGTITDYEEGKVISGLKVSLIQSSFLERGQRQSAWQLKAQNTTNEAGWYIFTSLKHSSMKVLYAIVIEKDTISFIKVRDDTTIVNIKTNLDDEVSSEKETKSLPFSNFSFFFSRNRMIIDNQEPNTQIEIFSLEGKQLIYKAVPQGRNTIQLYPLGPNTPCILLVRSNQRTEKYLIKTSNFRN